MVSASQFLSLDAGVTNQELSLHTASLGYDQLWLSNATASLIQARLLITRGERMRTPHLRIADRALLVLCRNPANPRWRDLIAFLRSRLLEESESLQGVLWLLRSINQADPLRRGQPELLLDETATLSLLERSLLVPAGRERGIAAYLIWELSWWKVLNRPMAEKVADVVPMWVFETTSADVEGIRWLLGGLRSAFPAIHGVISSRIQPEDVAERIAEHASGESGASWGDLITELAYAESVDTGVWAARFETALNTDAVIAWIQEDDAASSLRGSVEFVKSLAGLAPQLASVLVAAMAPSLSARLENDPSGAAHDLVPWAFSVFPLITVDDADVSAREADYRSLRTAVMDWIDQTDWEQVGRRLATGALHETHSFDLLMFSIHAAEPRAYVRADDESGLPR